MIDLIRLVADKLEPTLSEALLNAGNLTRAGVDLSPLVEAINNNDAEAVTKALGIEGDTYPAFQAALETPENAPAFTKIAADGFSTAAMIAAGAIVFAMPRQNAQNRAQESAKALSTTLAADAAKGASEAVKTTLATDATPRNKARQIVASIGLTANQVQSLNRLRSAFDTILNSPTLRGRIVLGDTIKELTPRKVILPSLRNLSASQRSLVQKAIQNGLTPALADRIIERHRRALEQHRATTIANTEATHITNAGEQAAWEAAVDKGELKDARRFWVTANDERVRASHTAIASTNAQGVGIKEPFETPFGPLMHPPAEINCRCRVRLLVENK